MGTIVLPSLRLVRELPGMTLDDSFIVYVVFDKPKDFPNDIVVGMWDARTNRRSAYVALFKTVAQAREDIPPGKTMIPRDPTEDPVIVETWI